MKKLIVLLFSVIMFSGAASAVDYRGFVEVNPGFTPVDEHGPSGDEREAAIHFFGSLSTTHGVQLNRHIFAGVGVDLNLNSFANEYPLGVNVYGDVRYDLDIAKKWSPYVNLKVGYGIKTADAYCKLITEEPDEYGHYDTYAYVDYKPFFINPSVGVRLRLSSKCGLNFGIGYIPTSLGKASKDQHNYGFDRTEGYIPFDKVKGTMTLNIGIDF